MQFACDSCKAQLQIADEKVRGKRLIVRCKRCGAKIAISDPALAKAAPRVIQAPSPAAMVAAGLRVEKPAPQAPPPQAPPPQAPQPQRAPPPKAAPGALHSDTESTRAMEAETLEKALQASRADNPA